MENNFIWLAALASHAEVYTIGPIFKQCWRNSPEYKAFTRLWTSNKTKIFCVVFYFFFFGTYLGDSGGKKQIIDCMQLHFTNGFTNIGL